MAKDSDARNRAEQRQRLLTFLHKIPLFSDLPTSTLRKVLSICAKVALADGQILCKKGDPSNAMYILLTGKLAVKIRDDTPVAMIEPVNSIGEMGVFTGEPRSATVQAVKTSALLILKSSEMNALIRRDTEFGVRIMSKVIRILSERISADNFRIQEFQKYIISQEEK
ncbi:MAG: cyclic nucleotide-binding domain-containing protein [Candidatus Latescibacteria bacterium]|nr:cyclic nucleotide-binding domain-containing protein [Candidatus Latescibacterota bacterium]